MDELLSEYANMHRPLLVSFIGVLILSCFITAAFAGTSVGALHSRIESLLQEGVALSQQRQSLTAKQTNLLQQKQALEASGQQLTQQQVQLNQQAEAHNQQVAAQEKSLNKNQSKCNDEGLATGANSMGHVNECDNEIKALNSKTAGINAGVSGLAGQQAAVAEQLVENNREVKAWYPQERQTVDQLNLVYQNTNDWMDRSYDLIASSRFQSAARAVHADKYCLASNQPSGMVTVPQLETASDYALSCLERVQQGVPE